MRALSYRHIKVSSGGGNSYQERTAEGDERRKLTLGFCGELPAPQAFDNLFRRGLLDNARVSLTPCTCAT